MRNIFHTIALLLFSLCCSSLWGQDIITTVKGKRMLVTVVDERGGKIVYRYSGSKTYKISKKDVQQVQYADGRTQKFSGKTAEKNKPAPEKAPAPVVKPAPAPERREKPSDTGFRFGLCAGGGVATGRYDYLSTVPPPATSFRLVPTAGINLDLRATRHFALQMNFLYKGKGDRINMNQWAQDIYADDAANTEPGSSVEGKGYMSTRIGYVEASLLPVIVFGRRIELGLGAYAGIGITGLKKSDYTLNYVFDEFPLGEETYQEEIPVEFVTLAPESLEEGKLYINRMDYGVYGHFGVRINPVKISLGLSYGLKQWEPDSKLSSLLFNEIDHTYNLSAVLTASWFFGGR